MAKVKYDYDGVEAGGGTYEGDDPKPGIYSAKISSAELGKSKAGNPMVTVTIDITKGECKGWRGWHYLVLTPESAWKEKEFTDALGLTKPGKKTGVWDTDNAVGKECRIKTRREMYEGEPQAKIKSVLAPKKDGDDEDDDDEADDDTPVTDDTEAADDVEEGDDEEDEAVAERRTELAAMSKPALKKALAATDSEFVATSKTSVADLIEAILDAEFTDDEEADDEEEEEDDEEGYDWDDLLTLDRAGLKKLIAEEELAVKVTKSTTDDALRAAVAAALEIEAGEPPF